MKDMKCPNCKNNLERLAAVRDVFKCPRENIIWRLKEKENGIFLEMLYAPNEYQGVLVGRVET